MAQNSPDLVAARFFLDSSVILAGCASSTGASHVLLVLAEFGLIRAVTIPYAFSEVERNLQRKLTKGIARYTEIQNSIPWEMFPDPDHAAVQAWVQLVPPKDTPILAATVAAQAAALVTLDVKHFINDPRIAESSGLTILTPGQVVAQIRAGLRTLFA